jgi:hypothetical protein
MRYLDLELVQLFVFVLRLLLLIDGEEQRILREVELSGEYAIMPQIFVGKGVPQSVNYLEQTFEKGPAVDP